MEATFLVQIDSSDVDITLRSKAQHELILNKSLRVGPVELPALTLNLYGFPKATKQDSKEVVRLSEAEQESMKLLLLEMLNAQKNGVPFFERRDDSGASPLHALLVANTTEALQLCLQLLEAKPKLLEQVHTSKWDDTDEQAPFDGESLLHILAANRREEELLRVIELSAQKLDDTQLKNLWTSQAQGSFFYDAPMKHYGGTALAYFCCFGMRDAVVKVLSEPKLRFLSLNKEDQACVITGHLPLHAVTANSMYEMYKFLVDKLPEHPDVPKEMHAKSDARTLDNLTPMQLAMQMGHKNMVKQIMRRQTRVLWKWGPVTQYEVDLECVDSAGKGGNDLMELGELLPAPICPVHRVLRSTTTLRNRCYSSLACAIAVGHLDATKNTIDMLLDAFIDGMLYKLFEQKWDKFAYKIWCLAVLLDAAFLLPLLAIQQGVDGCRAILACSWERSITSKGRSDAGSPVQVNAADLASAFNAQALALSLKAEYTLGTDGQSEVYVPIVLLAIAALVTFEALITREWWKNNTVTDVLIKHRKQTEHGPPDKKPGSQQEGMDPVAVQVGYLLRWQNSFLLPHKFFGCLLTVIACTLIIFTQGTADGVPGMSPAAAGRAMASTGVESAYWYDAVPHLSARAALDETAGGWTHGRALKAGPGGGTSDSDETPPQVGVGEGEGLPPARKRRERVFGLLSLASFLSLWSFIGLIVMPMQQARQYQVAPHNKPDGPDAHSAAI